MRTRLLCFGFFLGTLLAAPAALARARGINIQGCNGCHFTSDEYSTVELTPSLDTFDPGESLTLTVTVSSDSLKAAGFYLKASSGEFSKPTGEGVRLANATEVTHSTPLKGEGSVSFQVPWKSPTEPGATDFEVYALAANGDGRQTGDTATENKLTLVYGCKGIEVYEDIDRDGFGTHYNTALRCHGDTEWSEYDTDCNDINNETFPGATEVCNRRDDNCDGQVDEGCEIVLPSVATTSAITGTSANSVSSSLLAGMPLPSASATTSSNSANSGASPTTTSAALDVPSPNDIGPETASKHAPPASGCNVRLARHNTNYQVGLMLFALTLLCRRGRLR